MRAQVEICGCFPTGRHYPGIADRLRAGAAALDVRGLASGFEPDLDWVTGSFVVIDFETTGIEPGTDRIVEVGLACFDDGVATVTQNWLVNPGMPIPETATQVHGITDEMVKAEPRFEEVWPQIRPLLEGRLPVAYNANFDKRMLLAELERAGEPTWGTHLPPSMQGEVEWIDPLVWARELSEESQSARLGEVCARLGIALENAHRAMHDAEAAGKVLLALAPRMPRTYGELIRVQVRYAAQQDVDMAVWRGRRF